MSAGRVAARYAKPILELAEEKGVLDKVLEDMKMFAGLCESNKDFALMLKSPIISHLKKASILKEVFTGKVEDLTLQAFDLMAKKNREALLQDVVKEFVSIYNAKKGYEEVLVTTTYPLDEAQRKAFEQLATDLGGKQPVLKEKVDSSIIGGYKLRVGDRQIDQSVSGQLKDLKLKFSK